MAAKEITYPVSEPPVTMDLKAEAKYDSDLSAESERQGEINEKRVLRKIDFRLLPLVVALHAISLVDRTNISVARISGMDDDLKLEKGERVSIVTSTFFIGYILFNIPSNLVIRSLGAARFLGTIAFAWGIATIAIGLVNTWIAAAVLRSLLGVFEAGNTPGSIFLVSAWYRKYEVQKRLAVYFLGSLFVQGFSNVFALGLVQIGKHTTYKGWRWIYIIEGSITSLLGILAYFYLIDFPDSPRTKFLSEKEKAFVNERLAWDRGVNENHQVTWQSIKRDLKDWKVWACAFIYFSATIGTYALGFFLPTILKKSLGFSQAASFLLSGVRDTFAVIVSFTLSWLSDRVKKRGPFVCGQALMSIVGLTLLAYAHAPATRLVGAFLGAAGSNAIIPSALAWQANNCREGRKRSVSSALQVMFGATGGLVASFILRQQDAPKYVPGLSTIITLQSVTIFLSIFLSLWCRRLNKLAEQGKIVLEGLEGFRYTM